MGALDTGDIFVIIMKMIQDDPIIFPDRLSQHAAVCILACIQCVLTLAFQVSAEANRKLMCRSREFVSPKIVFDGKVSIGKVANSIMHPVPTSLLFIPVLFSERQNKVIDMLIYSTPSCI